MPSTAQPSRSEQPCPSDVRQGRAGSRRSGPAGPAANRADFCSMPRASCSPARTTAAPRHARSPKPPASTSTCCSATSARRPDCSGKPWSYRSRTSSTNSAGRGRPVVPDETDEEELARHFVGQLYDVVVEHRGLLLTLVASEAFSEDEIADAGIADITAGARRARSDQRRGHASARTAVEPARPARALDGGDDRRHGRSALDLLRQPSRLHVRRSSTNSSRRSCTASCTAATETLTRAGSCAGSGRTPTGSCRRAGPDGRWAIARPPTAWRSLPRTAPSVPPRR